MTKAAAVKLANKLARKNPDNSYFVYHWTDYPRYAGPGDYNVISDQDYWHDPASSFLDEQDIVYNTDEGWH